MDADAGRTLRFRLRDAASFERSLAEIGKGPGISPGEARSEDLRLAVNAGATAPVPPEPGASIRVRRTVVPLSLDGGGLVLLTAETGEIRSGAMIRAVCDFEFELVNGGMRDLVDLVSLAAVRHPCHLVVRSLEERGSALAPRTSPAAPRPAAPAVDRNGTAVGEFRRRLKYLLHEAIRHQEAFLDSPDDIEALHRLRVSIRRFRALLSFLRPALPTDAADRRQDALRKLGRTFAPLRDLDVLMDTWDALQAISPAKEDKDPSLGELFRAERSRLANEAVQRLADGAATSVFLGLWDWLHGDGRIEDPDWTDLSLKYELPHRLKKWDKSIRRDFRDLTAYDPAAVHALRIRCKKLRYVLEEFSSVLPKKQRKRAAGLKDLQDLLGAIHDTHRGIEVLDGLTASRRSARIQYERGVFTGFLQYRCAELYEELSSREDDF